MVMLSIAGICQCYMFVLEVIYLVNIPIVKWYFGLNVRNLIGSSSSKSRSDKGVI
jgi:hypothetical protein